MSMVYRIVIEYDEGTRIPPGAIDYLEYMDKRAALFAFEGLRTRALAVGSGSASQAASTSPSRVYSQIRLESRQDPPWRLLERWAVDEPSLFEIPFEGDPESYDELSEFMSADLDDTLDNPEDLDGV